MCVVRRGSRSFAMGVDEAREIKCYSCLSPSLSKAFQLVFGHFLVSLVKASASFLCMFLISHLHNSQMEIRASRSVGPFEWRCLVMSRRSGQAASIVKWPFWRTPRSVWE